MKSGEWRLIQSGELRVESGDYISLFPGVTREKQRFMALAVAVLGQVTDLQAVVAQINEAFAPGAAEGVQLEALAASLGLSRLDTSDGAVVTDEVFRDFVLKKLIRWSWDGTNGSVPGIVTKLQPGAVETDNQDGTMTITGAGTQPGPIKGLFPVTAAIRVM